MRGLFDYAQHRDESGRRRMSWAVLLIIFLVSALSVWRASLPTNQHRELDVYYHGTGDSWGAQRRMFNGFDDVATVVQAYHFARDGFWRTHLLPNRAGAPLISLFDAAQTQCKPLQRQSVVPQYRNGRQWVPMISLDLDGDCIYAHYPPLADWIFGVMAALGYEQILHYRLLAITVSAASLWLLFLWLRGEVSELAAVVTLALVATLPAFYQWAAALYYVPFQYLFLLGGILTWSKYQRRPQRAWFILTWLQFFAEAMVSHELTLCFGIILCGLELLEAKGARRFRLRLLLLQASAPTFALLLHFGLKCSLFGLSAAWRDNVSTFVARAVQNPTHWELKHFLLRIRHQLLRLDLIVLCVILVVLVRIAVKAPLKRPLGLLGIFLVGAASFMLVFPGTFIVHHWMMYRHFLLFSGLLLALVVDGLVLLFPNIRDSFARRAKHKRMVIALTLAALSLLPLSWTALRNWRDMQADLAWQNARLRSYDPSNLALRFLDIVYWTDGGPIPYDGHIFLTVDGERATPFGGGHPEFAISSKGTTYQEIWWFEPVDISKVSILTERDNAQSLVDSCSLSWFDGAAFRSPPTQALVEIEPFQPNRGEPSAPNRSWVQLRSAMHARSVRLACAHLPQDTPIYEVEVR